MTPLSTRPRPAYDPDTAADLLLASGRGDALAFAQLYAEVGPRVYGLVCRVVGDEHQSQEVTQEVFLEVWRTGSRFDPDRGTALSWLMTLAHHRAVDRVRRAEGWRRRELAYAEHTRTTPFDETAAAAQTTLDAHEVRAALEALPAAQRQAVELAYFGGYTYREVSGLLQLPLGTVKSRIRDGLRRLRVNLSALAVEPA